MPILLFIFTLLIAPITQAAKSDAIEAKVAVIEGKEYDPVTFENLSKTYWWLSMHDVGNETAIDEFARIHFCKLYETYFNDDFQWQLIREGIKEEVSRNRSSYPNRYYISAPVLLDRYDFENSIFMLDEKSAMNSAGVLTMLDYRSFKPYCGSRDSVPEYPDQVYVRFSKPVDFLGVPLSQVKAQELLNEMKETGNDRKVLYVRLYFRISGFEKVVNRAISNIGTLKGILERLEVYDAPDGGNMVYGIDIKTYQ